jgi:hypothetical protein
MYEHSIAEGIHSYDIGIGGDSLLGPQEGVINERQIFVAHDHAPEHWDGNVLVQGGKHYGHIEIDVRRQDETDTDTTAASGDTAGGFSVTITPVHVFPVLDPDTPGTIVTWERREYDDTLTFTTGPSRSPSPSEVPSGPQDPLP